MTASRIHRLTLTHFRNYRAASLQTRGDVVVLVGPNGAGKTNCIEAISFLSPGRGLRRATLDDVADIQGDGSWAVSAEVEGALGPGHARHRHRRARQRGGRHQPALPDRPRAGEFGDRVRRSSAHGVADAVDGRAVSGCGLGAAAVFRPAGAGDRLRAFQPGVGAGPLLALAQPPARGAQLRRPLVRRDRARDRRTRRRGRGDARPDRDAARGDAARARRGLGVSLRPDHARRLDGKRADQRTRHRGGGSLPRDPARQPRPRRRRRPHARRSASHRPAGDLRAEEHAGARRLHRRTEGAADRAGAGACQSGRGDDRHHAAVAARRGGRASRSRPAHGVVR